LVLCVAPRGFADGLNITGGVPGIPCGNPSVSSGSLSFSCPPSPLSGVLTSSGSGNLSTGVFGAQTEVSGVSFTTGGTTSADVFVTYNFVVSGAANGTAYFDISAPGIISCQQCGNGGNATALIATEAGESINGVLGGNAALVNGANNVIIGTPIGNGTATLYFALELTASCDGGPGYNGPACTTNLDFVDPLTITGASAYDSSGNLVPGATFVSESGFNPNAPVSTTPEPSTIAMVLTGCIGVGLKAIRSRLV
jgi:hypothetical protein